MAAFATVEDFATHPPAKDLSAQETATVTQLLDMATAVIQSYMGQTISLVSNEVVTLDVRGRDVVFLPQVPVVSVASLLLDGVALTSITEYSLNAKSGSLYRAYGGFLSTTGWGSGAKSVVATYTHGYATIPETVKNVCLNFARRQFDRPLGITAESIGTYSRTLADEGTDLLTPGELAVLNAYIPWAFA